METAMKTTPAMQITTDTFVSFDYVLTADSGDQLATSEGRRPMTYVQGHGSMIAGLEKVLEGKVAGSDFKVRIAPEDAYGPRNKELIHKVPRHIFEGMDEIEPGMQFHVPTPEGEQVMMVIDQDEETVTVDANHPLAGAHLNFDVKVRDVRAATAEELEEVHRNCACH